MPEASAPDNPGTHYPRALLGVYVRTSLWFLGLVAVLWMLGFEAIHGHPTPFYALIAPAFGDWTEITWNIGGAVVAIALLFLLVHQLVPRVLSGQFTQRARSENPLAQWNSSVPETDIPTLILSPEAEMNTADAETVVLGGPVLNRKQLALLVAFAALFPAAIAMMRGGPDGISQAYARQSYEYINDIGVGGSIRGLFHDYEKYHQLLSMHAKVHPPGPIAILWVLSYVAGRTPMGLSIATILFGALSVVPMYWLARAVLGGRAGLIAALLYALTPSIVIFTATSADITFMPFTLMTLYFFWRAIHGEGERPREASSGGKRRLAGTLALPVSAGILYGILGLISYSLVGIGVFFGLVGLWRLFDARYRWAVVRTAVIMAVGAIGVHYLVYLWSGYNSITVFQLSKAQFDTDQANLDLMDPRWPAWAFRFVNPLCWFFFAGIPLSVLALRRIQSSFSRDKFVFLVIGLTLLAFDILYLARGEGERSAMYVMPFIALPAAHMLDEVCAAARSWRPLTVTLAFLGIQCIAIEAILYTYW